MAKRLKFAGFEMVGSNPAYGEDRINGFLASKKIGPDDIYLIEQSSAAVIAPGDSLTTVLHVTIWYFEKT